MRSLILVLALLVAAAVAVPLHVPDEDWQLIPDSNGALHLVDIKSSDIEIGPAFNAWTDVRFLIFTSSSPLQGRQVHLNNAAELAASFFNPAHPVRFIVHGWIADYTARVNTFNTAAYLGRGHFNVVVVDWSAGAMTENYVLAQGRVRDTGIVCAAFADFLNVYGVPFSQITAIGHSLGGHVVGFLGKHVTRGRIASIVSMDPALPLFSFNNPAGRVAITDADYVEIIHTDNGRLGFDVPIGHADFYPNWGWMMPGCGPDLTGFCSHSLAWEYMAESIRIIGSFYGSRCSGWPAIQARLCPPVGVSFAMGGEPANNGAFGVFFMETNAAPPFGRGWRA